MALVRLTKDIKNAAKIGGLGDVTAIPKAQLSALQTSVLQKCDIINSKEREVAGLEERVANLEIQLENLTSITSQQDDEIARLRPFEEEAMRLRPRIGPLQDEIIRLTGDLRASRESAKGFEAECKLQKKRFAIVQSEFAGWKQSDGIMVIKSQYREENLRAKAELEATVQELVLNFASKIKNILDQSVDAKAAEHQIDQMKPRILLETLQKECGNIPNAFLSASDEDEKENKSYVRAIIQGLKAVAMCSVRQKAEIEQQGYDFSQRLRGEKLHHTAVIAEYQKNRSLQLEQERKAFIEEKEAISRRYIELMAKEREEFEDERGAIKHEYDNSVARMGRVAEGKMNELRAEITKAEARIAVYENDICGRNAWASALKTHIESVRPLLVIDFQGAIDVLSRATVKISTDRCHWYARSRMEKNLKELISNLREEQALFSERTQFDDKEFTLPDGLKVWTNMLREVVSEEAAPVIRAAANYFYVRSRE
ncbi:uncharacterized protein K441DRAFT_651538 [Cenococcum geophilum 1.58]|uniref:uncharacterized protein n=1 Tax=Cenococcum geophilum 1.58 TaxID=794803 RepID=UPI00358ECCB2|nr:hypothetical protein K441DRAFT_651538 [Cenococcum geophilum 1.58]